MPMIVEKKKLVFISLLFVVLIAIAISVSYFYRSFIAKEQKHIIKNLSQKTTSADQRSYQGANIAKPVENFAIEENEETRGTTSTFPVPAETPTAQKPSVPEGTLEIEKRLVSWGYEKTSQRNIDTVIVHSSYDAIGKDPYSVEGLINEYHQYSVSPHYLVDRNGRVYLLVEENNKAYHAGKSRLPDGRENANDFSIGIEMMNTKKEKYTEAQYDALNMLITGIKKRHVIKYILGHNQISSDRKDDPWNIDWSKITEK